MRALWYTETHQRRILRILPELVRARWLLFDMVLKDLRVRYRYAMMGFLWAVLEPLAMTATLTFVFTFVFDSRTVMTGRSSGHPYPVMLLCGLIPWQFFAQSVSAGARSLFDNRNLVQKVRFPREVVPLAEVGVRLVNFAIAIPILLVLHLAFGGSLGGALAAAPLIFAIQLALVIGLVLLASCLNVYFHDVSYMVDVAMMLGFYATPVFYPVDLVRTQLAPNAPWLHSLYMLNPMAGLIDAYRAVLLDNRMPAMGELWWPALFALVMLVAGVYVFRRFTGTMADHL